MNWYGTSHCPKTHVFLLGEGGRNVCSSKKETICLTPKYQANTHFASSPGSAADAKLLSFFFGVDWFAASCSSIASIVLSSRFVLLRCLSSAFASHSPEPTAVRTTCRATFCPLWLSERLSLAPDASSTSATCNTFYVFEKVIQVSYLLLIAFGNVIALLSMLLIM